MTSEGQMLRITVADTAAEQRWVVHGRLTEPWVSELWSTWEKADAVRRGKECVVDLNQVTYIDECGEEVLLRIAKEGARLVAGGLYTKQVVEQVRKRSSAASGTASGTHWPE